jgi:hypothetical protein
MERGESLERGKSKVFGEFLLFRFITADDNQRWRFFGKWNFCFLQLVFLLDSNAGCMASSAASCAVQPAVQLAARPALWRAAQRGPGPHCALVM